jgi:taurine dioxygenase
MGESMSITVEKRNGALGARLHGIDFGAMGDTVKPDVADAIADALYEHSVVAIDASAMTDAQHLELARHFGEPERHQFFPNMGPGLEEVTVLDSERDQTNMWHCDEPFLTHPPIVTMTHALQLPSFGGDTAFISLHAAYAALSDRMKTYVDGLETVQDLAMIAEHSWRGGNGSAEKLAAMLQLGRTAIHLLVLVHPRNGRKAIWVNDTYTRFILGVPSHEARAVLAMLLAHLQKPEFQYRHTWRTGDLMIWDNRAVLHYASTDYDERRIMHRVSVLAAVDGSDGF